MTPTISKNVKRLLLGYSIVALLIGSISVADNINPSVVDNDYDEVEPFTAQDFKLPLEYQGLIGDYNTGWTRLTGFEFSGLHWNHFVVIYVNKEPEVYAYNYQEYVKLYVEDDWDSEWGDEESVEAGFKQYSEGTVFLKEHYVSSSGRPSNGTMLVLMIKEKPGYDPEYGNWKYVWIDGITGTLIDEGNSSNKNLYANCIECHANMADRDYVFSTYSRATFASE